MRGLVLLAVVMVSGCSLFEPPKSAPGTTARLCEDAADADPKLRDYWATTPSNTPPSDFTDDYRHARQGLIADCLRIRSGRPAGGVERPIR